MSDLIVTPPAVTSRQPGLIDRDWRRLLTILLTSSPD